MSYKKDPVIVKRNKFGNYEHEGTRFLLSRATQKVYGKQKSDGSVASLTKKDIEVCKSMGFYFDLEPIHEMGNLSATSQSAPVPCPQRSESMAENAHNSGNQKIACIVCMENEVNCQIFPCNHVSTCVSCCEKLSACPSCRREITNRTKVFIQHA